MTLLPWRVIPEVPSGAKPPLPTVTGPLMHPALMLLLSLPPSVTLLPGLSSYTQALVYTQPLEEPKLRQQEDLRSLL